MDSSAPLVGSKTKAVAVAGAASDGACIPLIVHGVHPGPSPYNVLRRHDCTRHPCKSAQHVSDMLSALSAWRLLFDTAQVLFDNADVPPGISYSCVHICAQSNIFHNQILNLGACIVQFCL